MKIGKFVGKKSINFELGTSLVQKFTEAGFVRVNENEPLLNDNIYFEKTLPNVFFKGQHKGWYTNNRLVDFKAVARKITVTLRLQEGYVEGGDVYCEQQFSGDIAMRGGLAYKYSRNQDYQLNVEWDDIRNLYDYDTDVTLLIDRLLEQSDEYLKEIAA